MADKPKLPSWHWLSKCPMPTPEQAFKDWEKEKKDSADKFCRVTLVENKHKNISNMQSRSGIPSNYLSKNFDDYIATNDNQRRALDVCKKYAISFEGKMKPGSSLFLAGGTATGKTHLACAVCNHAVANHTFDHNAVGNKAKIIYTTFADVMVKIKSSWGVKGMSEQGVINEFSHCLLLIIDEIGVQFGTDFEKNSLFKIVDNRSSNSLPTIMLSNHSVTDVKGFVGDRVVSRIRRSGGGFLPFEWDPYSASKSSQ